MTTAKNMKNGLISNNMHLTMFAYCNYIGGRFMDASSIELFRAKLREIERAVWRQTKTEALCCGVTLAQCHAILEIGAAGELNLKELAERLGLDNSTLSRTVESLVKDGLAERAQDAKDRRATVIRLNKKGHAARDRINTTWNGICRDMFRTMPREKHNQLIESVSILAELLTGCCRDGCSATGKVAKRRTHV
jgi:DNA-binding MarR family transcriptional regulator